MHRRLQIATPPVIPEPQSSLEPKKKAEIPHSRGISAFFSVLRPGLSSRLVVNLPALQELGRFRSAVVDDLAAAQVKGADGGHLLLAEAEIPDAEVFLHPLPVGGLGDDDHAALGVPAQGHLGGGLAIAFPLDRRVVPCYFSI